MEKRVQRNRNYLPFYLSIWVIFLIAPVATGQTDQFRIDYSVRLASTETQLFHVTADITNIHQDRLELSLPIWTPGWYTIENYAKNILRFKVTDSKGAPLSHTMTRKQTWSVDTRGQDRIRAEFDYRASVLALNQAR